MSIGIILLLLYFTDIAQQKENPFNPQLIQGRESIQTMLAGGKDSFFDWQLRKQIWVTPQAVSQGHHWIDNVGERRGGSKPKCPLVTEMPPAYGHLWGERFKSAQAEQHSLRSSATAPYPGFGKTIYPSRPPHTHFFLTSGRAFQLRIAPII